MKPNAKPASAEGPASPHVSEAILAASRWDERLAEARERRERVLAERPPVRIHKPKPWEEAGAAPAIADEIVPEAPAQRGRIFTLCSRYPFHLATLSAFFGFFAALFAVELLKVL